MHTIERRKPSSRFRRRAALMAVSEFGLVVGSVADKFGLYPDDVIQKINGKKVSSKSQAINVVRNEIDVKKRKIIEVDILRNGKKVKKRYDTRDPEMRRAARSLK